MFRGLVGLLAVGCGTAQGPLFTDISNVNITKVSSAGTALRSLNGGEVGPFAGCLGATSEIAAEQAEQELLVSTYLVEVTDASGKRSFELYTAHTMKGSGKYYSNPCVYEQIMSMGL